MIYSLLKQSWSTSILCFCRSHLSIFSQVSQLEKTANSSDMTQDDIEHCYFCSVGASKHLDTAQNNQNTRQHNSDSEGGEDAPFTRHTIIETISNTAFQLTDIKSLKHLDDQTKILERTDRSITSEIKICPISKT